jgi:integrase
MEKVKKLPEDTSRAPRALSHGEVRALFAVAEGTPYKTYVALAVFTGMRPSEILTLRWKAVAFAQRQIHVQSTSTNPTKNHRSRILPMAPELEAVLSGLPEGEPESLVFAGPDGKPISRFTVLPAVKRLFDQAKPKIKDANLYSLRHSFGTLMAERGVPIQDLQAMMGHSSITVTARYLHPLRLRAGTLPTLSFAQPEKPVVPVNSAAGA